LESDPEALSQTLQTFFRVPIGPVARGAKDCRRWIVTEWEPVCEDDGPELDWFVVEFLAWPPKASSGIGSFVRSDIFLGSTTVGDLQECVNSTVIVCERGSMQLSNQA
jgi:hypothetical protein